MTMDDITLNIFVPEPRDKLKKTTVRKNINKSVEPLESQNIQNHVKKKKTTSINDSLIKIPEKSNVVIVDDEQDRLVGNKREKKLLKRPNSNSLKSDDGEIVKKKKKILQGRDSNKETKYSALLFPKDSGVNVSDSSNVKPIYEPLFSANTFESISTLHPHLVANLRQLFNIETMTVVQQITIPVLFSRKDALIRSQTGSGKTLAYAVPVINFLQDIKPKISRTDGVKALVVLPTRELALQTYECFQKLVRAFTWLVPGLLVGGEKRKSEKARLRKGITILIGTPGRLLDHVRKTSSLSLKNVEWFILDEADKLLDLGYEEAIGNLLEVLKNERSDSETTLQTVLLSATLTTGVERLAGLALNSPVRLDASENASENTKSDEDELSPFIIPQSLDQKFVIVPAKLRLVLLAATIIFHYQLEKTCKVLIFMATQDMVNFYTDLLSCVPEMENISFFKLHGNMTQIERTEVFKKFRSTVSGVLLCTDVAARGLDLPKTDVIIQYNAPPTPSDYVHRVGRTARVGLSGVSILFLESSEMNFLHWLNEKRIRLVEQNMEHYLEGLFEMNADSIKNNKKRSVGIEETANALQLKFENAISEDKQLHDIACEAYKSWVRFYASYPKESRTVFCFKQLHLGHHAKSFAVRDAPSAIGGIGKPKDSFMKNKSMQKKKKKDGRLKVETMNDKTERLIISEFESGIKFKRKKT